MTYNTTRFQARTPAAALDQIQRQLGPDAVVLSVRHLPPIGVARLWQKHGRVEILAGVPSSGNTLVPRNSAPDQESKTRSSARWPAVAWLEAHGLLAAHADTLQERLQALHPAPLDSAELEWLAVRAALGSFWPSVTPSLDSVSHHTHVFIGPPGSGKTTALCKWLTLSVLTEEQSARVWRLDSAAANTAEFLSVHCETLGVPVERYWGNATTSANLHFIDVPGTETGDRRALLDLREQLSALPGSEIHLVLNAAYETETLLSQWQAFAAVSPTDLILTHLDEETRRVKLWNLVFGTNCRIRFLGAGQKIPGEFQRAMPDFLFPSDFGQ